MSETGTMLSYFDEVLDRLGAVVTPEQVGDSVVGFHDRLCAAVSELASVDRLVLLTYDPGRHRLRSAGSSGVDLTAHADREIALESIPAARLALAENRTVEVVDLGEELAGLGLEEAVCVPLISGGQWFGVMVADVGPGGLPLDAGDCRRLTTVVKAAAMVCITRSETCNAEAAKHLEQRISLAREIHDGTVQRLFGVYLVLSGGEDLTSDELERCTSELHRALHDLRHVVQQPLGRTPRTSQLTLAEEIDRLRSEYPELGVDLVAGDPEIIPDELQGLAQSVLCEAVRNAHAHAQPRRVSVRVAHPVGAWSLTITNDGVNGRSRHMGMGLRIAAFDALHYGGVLEFGPKGPGYWQVRLVVPDGTC